LSVCRLPSAVCRLPSAVKCCWPLQLFVLFFSASELASAKARPKHWATPIDKRINLHQMDNRLFRSAMPDREAIGELKALGIGTLINFYQESDSAWLGSTDFQEIHLPMRMRRFDDEDAIAALRSIRKAQKHGAVLIHCRHGQNRTGLVAALYRVIYQGWSKQQALAEMRQGFGTRGMQHGIAYLQNADIDALKKALNSGACSTSKLAWCRIGDWL